MDGVELDLESAYQLGVRFFREKEGKAFHLSYEDRLQLLALTRQVKFGSYKPDSNPEVGLLDVVGNERRKRWQALGDIEPDEAKKAFLSLLQRSSNKFRPYLEAHQREEARKAAEAEEKRIQEQQEREQQERLKLAEVAAAEEARANMDAADQLASSVAQVQLQSSPSRESSSSASGGVDQQRRLQHESQIRAALNQQTIHQFRQYAQEQHPKDSIKQEELIRQLQEQHFQQYMTQVYQQQIVHQQQQYQQLQSMQRRNGQPGAEDGDEVIPLDGSAPPSNGAADSGAGGRESLDSEEENASAAASLPLDNTELPQIVPASLWTRRDLVDFKQQIWRDTRECCIKIGSLATATVRVPTHEEGSCIFWEFATDHYDIGFGVYFEWTLSPSNKVTVHISESSDDEEEGEEGTGDKPADVESGSGGTPAEGGSVRKKKEPKIPTDEIIPVYRRDSHEEVYCGSHQYPGRGVYLLKFDNSYSLWRSKWLYYRVYYTR